MSRTPLWKALTVVAAAAVAVAAPPGPVASKPGRIAGKRTLVVAQDEEVARTHSKFLAEVKGRAKEYTFKTVSDTVSLERYGEPLYDNIVLLAPAATDFGGLSVSSLTSFVDNGGNLLVAGGPDLSAEVRALAAEFGLDYDAPRARVVDHFAYDATDGGKHTRVLTTAYHTSPYLVGSKLAGGAGATTPVVYEGVGMAAHPDNILVTKALTVGGTGYSAVLTEAIKGYPQSAGAETILVAAVQGRNNARATFTGSMWFLSDAAFGITPKQGGAGGAKLSGSGNAAFAAAIARWTSQESGVLRVRDVQHRHADGSAAERQVERKTKPDLPLSMHPEPEIARESLVYRIKDDVQFTFAMTVLDGDKGDWTPYVARDVQLEFVMLDPYIRTFMNASTTGTYSAAFRVPDVYGIYNFRVHYRRPGLSLVSLKEQVSVRPFRHNEYERFISSAYPYYTTAFTLMAAVFTFSYILLAQLAAKPAVATPAPAAGGR